MNLTTWPPRDPVKKKEINAECAAFPRAPAWSECSGRIPRLIPSNSSGNAELPGSNVVSDPAYYSSLLAFQARGGGGGEGRSERRETSSSAGLPRLNGERKVEHSAATLSVRRYRPQLPTQGESTAKQFFPPARGSPFKPRPDVADEAAVKRWVKQRALLRCPMDDGGGASKEAGDADC